MAFYKNDNGNLLVGENFVYTHNFSMTKETKDEFDYPIEGWYWFDTKEEAYGFFGVIVDVNKY